MYARKAVSHFCASIFHIGKRWKDSMSGNRVILSVTLVMRARHSPLRLILLLRTTFFPHRLEQARIPTATM
jgi:hypothetical protein